MSAPIPYTCPDIDKIVKRLSSVMKMCNNIRGYDFENSSQMQDVISECTDVMDDAICYFESLRLSNDSLRKYGEEYESEYNILLSQYEELETKLANLS